MIKQFTLTEGNKKELENAILAARGTDITVGAGEYLRFTVVSALSGDSVAQYQMGNFYLNGCTSCLSLDLREAIRYFKASAKGMCEKSIMKLFDLYLNDQIEFAEIEIFTEYFEDETPKDSQLVYLKGKVYEKLSQYDYAYRCFELAASRGHVAATIAWADLVLKGRSKYGLGSKFAINILKPLSKEDASVQFKLAEVLRSLKKNPPKEKIFALYKKATKQKHEGAMAKLYECYLHGYGVEKNEDKAQKWYRRLHQLASPGKRK